MMKTSIEELARGLVKQERGYVRDMMRKRDAKEKQKAVREYRIRAKGWRTIDN